MRLFLYRCLDPMVAIGSVVAVDQSMLSAAQTDQGLLASAAVVGCVGHLAFAAAGVYGSLRRIHLGDWLGSLLVGAILTGLIAAGIGWWWPDLTALSLTSVGLWMSITLATLALVRVVHAALLYHRSANGRGVDRIVLAGHAASCREFFRQCHRSAQHGGEIVAIAERPEEADGAGDVTGAVGVPVGAMSELAGLVEQHRADRVIICASVNDQELISRCLYLLRHHPLTIQLRPELKSLPIFCCRASEYAGQPMLSLTDSPFDDRAIVLKTIEDKVLSAGLLLLFAPLMGVIALLVKLTSPGPILFVQERHGVGGRPIKVYKFRSMYTEAIRPIEPRQPTVLEPERRTAIDDSPPPSAEPEDGAQDLVLVIHEDLYVPTAEVGRRHSAGSERLRSQPTGSTTRAALRSVGSVAILEDAAYRPQPYRPKEARRAETETQRDTDIFQQASHDDPRITRIGRFLRRTSLDELPQLINVLQGRMSLVGPRPHAISHNFQYTDRLDSLMRRHYVKPGITGLAQIRGARGETRTIKDMRRRVGYDLFYINNWSLWLDIKILIQTAWKGFLNREP